MISPDGTANPFSHFPCLSRPSPPTISVPLLIHGVLKPSETISTALMWPLSLYVFASESPIHLRASPESSTIQKPWETETEKMNEQTGELGAMETPGSGEKSCPFSLSFTCSASRLKFRKRFIPNYALLSQGSNVTNQHFLGGFLLAAPLVTDASAWFCFPCSLVVLIVRAPNND